MRTLVLSGWAGKAPEYLDQVIANHKYFCEHHGYDYAFLSGGFGIEVGSHMDSSTLLQLTSWLKAEGLRSNLHLGHSHIFWIDADSVFADKELSLDDILNLHSSLVFTGDPWDMCNTGHLLIRNDAVSESFIEEWLSLRGRPLPRLATTHQTEQGLLVDQPAFNITLGSYDSVVGLKPMELADVFNRVNGYKGNPQRRHKFFEYTHAPTRPWRLPRTRSLIAPRWRDHCAVVIQSRLNAYPGKIVGSGRKARNGPIIHFAGRFKSELPRWLDENGFVS